MTTVDRSIERRGSLPRRRKLAGWTLATAGAPLLTLTLVAGRAHVDLPGVMLLYLLLVVIVATAGGAWPAVTAAVAGSFLVNWFFTPPFHTWTIAEPAHVLALVVFVVVALVVSAVVSIAARRANEAARAGAEAEALAGLAGVVAGSADPVPELVASLRSTFDLDGVAVLSASGDVEALAGAVTRDGARTVPLPDGARLALSGALRPDDRRVLDAFTAQLVAALERGRVAAEARELAAVDELRTALLAAVSHDLRTPLSSIKASVTSLLQRDVDFTPEATKEFLETIADETDRLNALVGNLLDMSRLQTGALNLAMREVGLDEVVSAALAGLGERGRGIDVDVSETLPRVRVDPALLERAVANVLDNAVRHGDVRVTALPVGGQIELRVADRGPGIAADDRERAFLPFERLGDTPSGGGVGLGMTVARGFVEAMGGTIRLEDTPGGGLTVVIAL